MPPPPHSPWFDHAIAFFAVVAATVLSFLVFPHLALINVIMIYLLASVAVAARGRRGPAVLAALLGVVSFDFFFVSPRFSFNVSDAQFLFTFVVMFGTAMIISHLTIRLRKEADAARRGETRAAAMHEFTRKLGALRGSAEFFDAARREVSEALGGSATIFFKDRGTLTGVGEQVSERELGVASWVFDQGLKAGLGADALPSDDALYMPLSGPNGVSGVLQLKPGAGRALSEDGVQMLESFCRQIALALDARRFEEEAKKAALDAESERMRSALLSSVSHDFRTPLAAIVGSASALLQRDDISRQPQSREMIENIESEARRLSQVVHNLLEATRLESGALKLKTEMYPLEEIVGSAVARFESQLKDRPLDISLDPSLGAVRVDGLLIEQVLINLLENAIRHTPAGSAISISAVRKDAEVRVSVQDRGPGIDEKDRERIFDKFYRSPSSPGAGLGLAICRAIIIAHGGRISAENNADGGAVFSFTLPAENSIG